MRVKSRKESLVDFKFYDNWNLKLSQKFDTCDYIDIPIRLVQSLI